MATPPTVVSTGTSAYTNTTTPKTVSVTVQNGDIICVVGGSEDSPNTLGTPTGNSLTYTLQQSITAASHSPAYGWTAPSTGSATFNVSCARTAGAGRFGISAPVFRGSDGVGASNSGTGTGAPTLNLTTTQDNSAIVVIITDWNAADGASRVYTQVNSLDPTEVTYARTAGAYTVYVVVYTDAGTAGSKTVGVNTTGTIFSAVAIEIKGAAGGGGSATKTPGPIVVQPQPPLVRTLPRPIFVRSFTAPAAVVSARAVQPIVVPPRLPRPALPARALIVRGSPDAAGPPTPTITFPGEPLVMHGYFAFGADLTADPDTWDFTEVTDYLRVPEQPTIKRGRTAEAQQAQPSTATFALNNPDGRFTPRRAMSPYYPYIRRDTPVRLTVDVGTGEIERFSGFVDTIAPAWDTSGKFRTAAVSASGILRRLSTGTGKPVNSALWRATVAAGPVAYWPLEDGIDATSGGSAITGGQPMVPISATPQFATLPVDPGSFPLPNFTGNAGLVGTLTADTSSGWAAECVMYNPEESGGEGFFQVTTQDGYWLVSQFLDPGAGLGEWFADFNYFDGSPGVHIGPWDAVDDITQQVRITSAQNGSDIDWTVTLNGTQVDSGTISSATMTRVVDARVYYQAGVSGGTDMAFGHVAVYDSASAASTWDAVDAYRGELATDRLTRLCAEVGIPLTIQGTSDVTMGTQSQDLTFLDTLREVETTDGGILGDGVNFGLTYECRNHRYNADTAITLDIPSGQFAPPFAPVSDDLRHTNDVTYKRGSGSTTTGSSARFVDDADVAAHGTVDTSVTANFDTDDPLLDHAAWDVHQGTVDVDRYPVLKLNLARNPELIDDWVAAGPGSRIVVTGKPETASDDDIDEFIEGYTETFDPFGWDVSLNCTPFEPWRVFVVEDDTLGRLGFDGQNLASGVDADDTTWSVASPNLPLMTTSADFPDDFPYYAEVDGEVVQVTATTGSSSPQTVTVV
ncbi:MAG TPA: hypothetical protein VHA75_08460, partial [Rugosimonospora sp.]|nr:hypothetical protein [Rugosimonospora sp.]